MRATRHALHLWDTHPAMAHVFADDLVAAVAFVEYEASGSTLEEACRDVWKMSQAVREGYAAPSGFQSFVAYARAFASGKTAGARGKVVAFPWWRRKGRGR